ncbi:microtubule-associated serine/threonine-protein kinase 3-like [Rhipicephalus sanguineus]|uniref:microtubule-associated serine/threonine-protein kinase 3-like n=1 Tax=Rhipicephalus sanguineus TaxID=34632 RepID=UPI0020C4AF6F|nr:microtubule-associated serine/threonine-protein kinase 3-like [Rhipicephalus sanguineus]
MSSDYATGLAIALELTVNAACVARALNPPQPLPFGMFLPRIRDFKNLKMLGAGGFGAVYLANYRPANFVATVKLVNVDRFSQPKQAAMDKVVASVIRNPFLVKYYCCFCVKEAYVTIMEYIAGLDLMRVVTKEEYLDTESVRVIMAQLILALEHMHLRGFLHRDVKVSNMLILPGGRVKVIDFDTAKACGGHFAKRFLRGYFRRTAFEFHDGESAGTIPYMAPEILKRRPYGRAADWWSAGIVMYKLMTGRVPFRGKSKQLLRERIISSPLKWPRPEDHPNSATTPGKDMTYRMLKKNPVDRLGSKNYSDLKTHPFFDQFNWQMLYKKELCNIPSIAEILHSDAAKGLTTGDPEDKRKHQQIAEMTDVSAEGQKPLLCYASPSFKKLMLKTSRQSLAECGSVSADGAGIGHSGCLVCELPEDDKHAILTPGVPPERRIEDHEGILVAIELTTDRSDSDQLGQSIEVPANNCSDCGVGSSNDCVKSSKAPISVSDSFMESSAQNSLVVDYKATSPSSTLSKSAAQSSVEGKESLPAEKVDIVLYRNKKYFKFSDFGFTLRRVRGEEANFIYVDAVTKGSPADVAKVLPLDVLMNVNGVPVGETPLAQINKIISSVGEQLAISVMASSPYRLLTSRRDMLGIMRSIPRESAVVKAAPGSSTGGKTYGVTILDVDVTDEKLKRSSKCFMLLRADVASCNNKMVFPGDVVFEINGTSVDGMSRPQVDQLLNTGKPEVTLCVVPLSPMRKNRYLISKLLETGGTDINVPSKSTGATIG